MSYVLLKSHDGKMVSPEIKSFQAAAANADWAKAEGFYLILTDQPGAASWPITGASFILVHQENADGAAVQAALKFFAWSYADGAALAEQLDYVPLPPKVVSLVQATWKTSVKYQGKALWPGR